MWLNFFGKDILLILIPKRLIQYWKKLEKTQFVWWFNITSFKGLTHTHSQSRVGGNLIIYSVLNNNRKIYWKIIKRQTHSLWDASNWLLCERRAFNTMKNLWTICTIIAYPSTGNARSSIFHQDFGALVSIIIGYQCADLGNSERISRVFWKVITFFSSIIINIIAAR